MATDERSVRSQSFGAIAEDYDRFRPGPPSNAVAWLLPPGCESAVDIGAGTGALTRVLVRSVPHVFAVEPDPRMAAVLGTRVEGVTVLSGRAEAIPLGDGSVDAVLGSSMWHWVDEQRASDEAGRVLHPGGILGLLWNGPDRSVDWVGELLGRPGGPTGEDGGTEGARRRRHEVRLPADAPFSVPEMRLFEWTLAVRPEDLVELAGTYSRFIVLPEPERARIRRELADVVRQHPFLAGKEELDLPMRCVCWRAVRQP